MKLLSAAPARFFSEAWDLHDDASCAKAVAANVESSAASNMSCIGILLRLCWGVLPRRSGCIPEAMQKSSARGTKLVGSSHLVVAGLVPAIPIKLATARPPLPSQPGHGIVGAGAGTSPAMTQRVLLPLRLIAVKLQRAASAAT